MAGARRRQATARLTTAVAWGRVAGSAAFLLALVPVIAAASFSCSTHRSTARAKTA
jgi:hypothetical protein